MLVVTLTLFVREVRQPRTSPFLSKKKEGKINQIQIFMAKFGFSMKKCFHLSTNKLSICSCILKIAPVLKLTFSALKLQRRKY